MSLGWVKKWKKRLQEAAPEEEQVLPSRSRARKQPPERISQTVTDRLIQMRDEPPEGLQRTPGPKAILYSLPRDEQLQGERLPRSSRTKRQHVVEVLNTVDEGTSVLVDAQVGADFHAETTRASVAELFTRHGLPEAVRIDRDVRLVSSPAGSDFPSAFVRFCQCLGVGVLVCDPHHPQQNGFVERSHRTSQEECLAVHRPGTLEEVREATAQFQQHYTWSRPLKAAELRQSPATGGLSDVT